MSDHILDLGHGFWNIRGSFKLGLLDIGTQASLVRLGDGRFLLLDSYRLKPELLEQVRGIVGEAGVHAILNLHPFHTVHVKRSHAQFPEAKLYGTARHVAKAPELPWEPQRSEDAELHGLFAADLDFSVPAGVDFISDNENLHFSSVLVHHRASSTVHVDDTFNFVKLPLIGELALSFHPTLPKVLERRSGAAQDFRAWARQLRADWGSARNLVSAHNAALLGQELGPHMDKALAKVEKKLGAHERKHG